MNHNRKLKNTKSERIERKGIKVGEGDVKKSQVMSKNELSQSKKKKRCVKISKNSNRHSSESSEYSNDDSDSNRTKYLL